LSNKVRNTATYVTTTTVVVSVVISLLVAGAGGYLIGQRVGQSSAKLESAVVATVNNEKISKLDLYNRMIRDNGTSALDEMIQEKLVDQEAAKLGVAVTAIEIDAEITKIKTRLGGEDAFQAALGQNGITLDQLKQYQAFQLKITRILGKDVKTDDETLKTFFTENTASFDKREAKARHILVETEDEAKAIKADLDKGGDFATIAKAKSTDPGSKEQGGDLGTFKRGDMVAEFEDAVFNKLKKNEISAPVKTTHGWHVIQLIDMSGTAPTFESVKTDVKDAYVSSQVSEKAQTWLADLKDKAKIENTLEKKES